jgi:Ca-activated chloride channel family protein
LNYQFQYPQAFWLLALLPLFIAFFLMYRRWKGKAIKKAGEEQLIRRLYPDHSSFKTVLKFSILMIAFVCGCIALANPRKPDASSAEARKGIDIVMALDVSNSMKATDIAPDRLSRAQQFISKLIDNLQDDRIGLVVFAGNAYAQMPLTFDREAAKMYTTTASPNNISAQGTSISDALKKSDLLFGEQTDRFRSVILITDGETHDDDALQSAKEMAAKGVMINTVGIGSPEGSTITDSNGVQKRDAAGQVVISKLNEQILQEIARTTNGVYVHLQNSDAAVSTVMGQFSQIEKKALGDTSLYTYTPLYGWLAVPMLLLLITEVFLPDRKKIK